MAGRVHLDRARPVENLPGGSPVPDKLSPELESLHNSQLTDVSCLGSDVGKEALSLDHQLAARQTLIEPVTSVLIIVSPHRPYATLYVNGTADRYI